ncbi:hypothetical protein T440DRAFT_171846 [Plenodomus tracheiphilus IPT5]|uniref:Uncharacterized protein n=1 Tax=Plenodomus tracheiphilus IPT5 TaxID=1408161 RepID=A0A6A7AZF4_9PLEO|nr:hypothetical protein T440DRAFT_171846 [Plenodomus tracheiphilus IPT5]
MFSFQPFLVLWLASQTAHAVILRRGSVNDAASFSNVSLITTSTLITTVESVGLLPVESSYAVQSDEAVDVTKPSLSSSQNAQPARTALFGLPSAPILDTAKDIDLVVTTTPSTALSTVEHPLAATAFSVATLYVNATLAVARQSSNASCTVNIPSASVDFWYPPTYSYAVGTMTTEAANFSNAETFTLVPQTTAFDVSSALETEYACTTSYSYMSAIDWTFAMCIEYTEKPVATVTSVAYRSAYSPFPADNTAPVVDALLYDAYTDGRPSAITTLSVAPNVTRTETSATPFVHFTAYEIEYGNRTETVRLSSVFVYPYWLEGVEQQVSATGQLPRGFLEDIPQSACDPGQLNAVITVVIVVDLYYQNWPNANPFIIHYESTALGFDDPPVVINNNDGASSRAVPFTVADWDLTGNMAKPTQWSVKPQIRPEPVPTTAARNHDNNNINSPGPQTARITVGNIGTLPVVVGPSSQIVVGSKTLKPGAAPIIVGDGTPVALDPSATVIIVGGTTSQLPRVLDPGARPSARPPPILTIGSSTFTPNAATQFLIAPDQTLSPDGVVTLDGTRVSLAPSASFVVVGSSTQALQPASEAAAPIAPSRPQIVIGGSTITAQPNNDPLENPGSAGGAHNGGPGPVFVVSGQTLAPGGSAITVFGTTLSLAPSGSFVMINGVSSAVEVTGPLPTVNIGRDMFAATSGPSGVQFIIDSQTLAPGGSAIIISGTTLSLAPSASFIVVDGVTSTLQNPAAAQITAPPLTIGDSRFAPLPGTGTSYLIFSMLLTPGGSIVVAGTTISLASGATALIVNGQTSYIGPQAQLIITNAPLLTVGSRTYTAVYGTTFIIDGKTLTPGGVITVDGTTISLAPGATELVYGSSGRSTSSALFPATTTRSQSITRASNPSAGASGGDGRAVATSSRQGAAVRIDVRYWVVALALIVLPFSFV